METTTNKLDWYRRYRKAGDRPQDALWSARCNADATAKAQAVIAALSPSSRARIEAFVDSFIRCEDLQVFTSERDGDYINEPERASRCNDAAEEGCDGKTHQDVIQDWRDYFSQWTRDHKTGSWYSSPDRFTGAVEAHFTLTEMYHEFAGTLTQEIG